MQHKSQSRQVTIHEPQAAAVFTQSRLRRVLLQFARRPRSISEVSRALAFDIKQLHYIVTKLCRLGLIEVVEERKRPGRNIKLYQCTATSYLIPSAAAPVPFSRGLAKELQAAIARDASVTLEGMIFSLDAQDRVIGKTVERVSSGPAPLDSWRILRLSASAASQLKQELIKVLDRFQNDVSTRGPVYLVHAGMAKRLEHHGPTDNSAQPVAAKETKR